MSARKKAFEAMVNGTPWGTITKTNSKSSIYGAYTEYTPIMKQKVEELRQEARELTQTRDNELSELDSLLKETEIAQAARDTTIKDSERASEKFEKINAKLEQAQTEFNTITSGLVELHSRGVSEQLVSKISDIDFAGAEDLVSRISTVEKYQDLHDEVKATEGKLGKLHDRIDEDQIKADRLSEEAKSTANQVALVRAKHNLIVDAVDVTQEALKRYPKKDLIGLFKQIRRIEIRGEPKTTLGFMYVFSC